MSTTQFWHWVYTKSIPSDSSAGKQNIDILLAQLKFEACSEDFQFYIHLALEEAIVNAIKHGNQNDRRKRVHIVYKISSTQVYISIADEGEGFDPAAVPDPTTGPGLELPSGRGLLLMRAFMDQVLFNDRGNMVSMSKQRVAIPTTV